MARKKNAGKEDPELDYYDLHKDAIESLAGAENGESSDAPKYSKEELRRYTSSASWHLPCFTKVFLVKWWFAGAVCYFFIWGLGMYLANLDMLLVTSIGMGFVIDFLENSLLRFMADRDEEVGRYIMFPKKRFVDLFLNIFYAAVLTVCVYLSYMVLNSAYWAIRGDREMVVPVEPILYGLFFALWDLLFLWLHRITRRIAGGGRAHQN